MRILPRAAAGAALLIVAACADGRDGLGPTPTALSVGGQPSAASASGARQVDASGNFAALVDFSTLTLTPRGNNCRLVVDGQLVFTGTIQGVATGTTSALVFAPCTEVATTPPGTYRDVFRSDLEFTGTVDGELATAKVIYQGGVEPGGQIDAHLIFSRGVAGVLDADAIVAVGGEYSGTVVVK